MLERIVYVSAAREKQSSASIERILDVSRERNAAAGVTGLLIGGGGWWMQLIEGAPGDLDAVWQSIRNDKRHDPVILVQRVGVRTRDFREWSLQFREADDPSFDRLLDELTGGLREPRLRHQVRRFAETFLAKGTTWKEISA